MLAVNINKKILIKLKKIMIKIKTKFRRKFIYFHIHKVTIYQLMVVIDKERMSEFMIFINVKLNHF